MSNLPLLSPRSTNSGTSSAELSPSKCSVRCSETHESVKALVTRIRSYIRMGSFEAALEDCNALLVKTPEHIQGRFLKGVCLDYMSRTEEAVEEFSLVLKLDPSHANATLSRASALIKLGQATTALEEFAQGLELDAMRNWQQVHRKSFSTSTYCSRSSSSYSSLSEPSPGLSPIAAVKAFSPASPKPAAETMKAFSPQEWYLKGCVAQRNGEFDEAVHCFSADLDMNSSNFMALLHRALAYERMEKPENALEDYSKAIALNPKSASAYHSRAMLLSSLNRLQEALSDLSMAISIENQAEFHHSRGQIYQQMGLKDLALQDYCHTLELDHSHAKVHTHRGICYEEMGRIREAVVDYESAITRNGDLEACKRWLFLAKSDYQRARLRRKIVQSPWIWSYIEGLEFEEKGEPAKAIDCFSSAKAAREAEGEIWLALARCRLAQGELDQALADCKDAESRGTGVHYIRGLVYTRLGLFANAVEDLRQARATVSVLTALGYAYTKGNNYVEAIKSYTQALCEDPKCIVALHNRGSCYQHLLQHAEVTSPQAISDFSTEISLQPTSLAYFSRGLSYELQGASTKALSDYSKSLDLSSTE